jgi:hypothetical protein
MKVMIGMSYILPLLEYVNYLRDVFVFDFIIAMKIYQGEYYVLYFGPTTNFRSLILHYYNSLMDVWRKGNIMKWITSQTCPLHVFVFLYHTLIMCLRLNVNEVLIQSLIWRSDDIVAHCDDWSLYYNVITTSYQWLINVSLTPNFEHNVKVL